VIVDVEATRSIRQAEVGSVRTILDRVKDKFDLHPERIIADTAYGSGPMLGWLVDRKIAPHIPVIDKATRTDGTWSRADFEWDADNNQYVCPEGEELKQFRRNYSDPNRGPDGITAGQVSDYTGAAALMNGLPEAEWLLADRGYDADWFRETLVDKGTKHCIPGRKSRKKAAKYDKRRYKRRNRIERMFGRLKDRRRVATRYDRSPTVFLSAIALAATVIFWL
jgi:transposase